MPDMRAMVKFEDGVLGLRLLVNTGDAALIKKMLTDNNGYGTYLVTADSKHLAKIQAVSDKVTAQDIERAAKRREHDEADDSNAPAGAEAAMPAAAPDGQPRRRARGQ